MTSRNGGRLLGPGLVMTAIGVGLSFGIERLKGPIQALAASAMLVCGLGGIVMLSLALFRIVASRCKRD